MKKFFPYLMLITGLFAVSCGSGYQVASSRYDDATYFRPDVTARVHMLATSQEAEALINETIIAAEKEGGKVETVYTDPRGVANIDVEPGTTYLVMNSQDDSYERKLEMFSDDPEDSFSLTINMSFDYSNWWDYPFYDYSWYGGWNRYRYWYMPMSYWDSWYWYPRTWYRDFWYNDWYYNYWYYPSWYHMWSYSGIWGIYPYGHHYYNNRTDRRADRYEYRNDRRQDLGRNAPAYQGAVRSGGSYTRTNPRIEQVSGNRAQRTRDVVDNKVDNNKEITSGSGTTNYRRVTGTTGSSAVYRDPASTTKARTEGSGRDNTFYRRSSNLSQQNRENTRSESSARTTNPGSSRSFYRGTQKPSATVNSGSSGSSRSVRSSSGSTSNSRSTGSYNSGSSYRSSSSSSATRSSSMGSSVSSGASRSSSSGSTGGGGGASRSGSGGSYRR
ncbi:MAG: hypothetical protein PHT35_06415 [Bacteroidales bacterium]|nr:hypothetical protein [Bacteroidales bacterium]MDD3522269.1 hypothetical protein [Bacteroidales bacterium]MDD4030584.1 hypothetical protein [Bacteroidales bacterium]MDD4435685.1 hypothetical protein [Bacteroidales bacterium]